MGPALDAQWLAALRARADVPPRRPRVPLWAGGEAIGTVEDGFINQIGFKSSSNIHSLLQKQEQTVDATWVLSGDPTESMDHLAQALRAAGLAGAWRDEQLAVHGPRGRRIGTIERGAVRPLGIATHAVHLTGSTPDGRVWVQQRAWDKANDPGLWDTLMGGMVPVNQDGEVAQFALLTRDELAQRLADGAFTLEAALILAAWLGVD